MMIDYDATIVLPLLFVFTGFLRMHGRKRGYEKNDWIVGAALLIYFLGVIKVTLFPIPMVEEIREIMQESNGFINRVNYMPFQFVHGIAERQVILNVIMTVPLGVLLPLVKRKRSFKMVAVSGIFFSAGIELAQLGISFVVGYPYRAIDIDDIILNTVGVVLGYAFIVILASCLKRLIKTNEVTPQSLIGRIMSVNKNKETFIRKEERFIV